jgi:hypothetical protein
VWLTQLHYVVPAHPYSLTHDPPVCSRQLENVVQVSVPDSPSERVRPEGLDAIAESRKRSAGLNYRTSGAGIGVRHHVRAYEDIESGTHATRW